MFDSSGTGKSLFTIGGDDRWQPFSMGKLPGTIVRWDEAELIKKRFSQNTFLLSEVFVDIRNIPFPRKRAYPVMNSPRVWAFPGDH